MSIQVKNQLDFESNHSGFVCYVLLALKLEVSKKTEKLIKLREEIKITKKIKS
jgi:hypothetical protein